MLGLVLQGDVAAALPAEFSSTSAGQTVFVQLLHRQLQLAELTALQTLHTVIRLGDGAEQSQTGEQVFNL